jgi:hypothetical protein
MSAKKTVDPEGEVASTRFIGLRVTTKQFTQIETLAMQRKMSKSQVLRVLIQEAWENVQEPF